ncbi:protein-serine/threonine phosphatase NDAI_0F02190 [Naumovozyma dairenensis CBS 421]|uniref:Serine/threonine-protein phosphatase n=1 Tax=Naumovozyma dairenensis (strain ATCC 10597 / BCRC 20456 / CBS 421 / NBRC 0211 / NRRL Y-12639) TaxID=1071378 RepID=G0WCM6_NAUDC|nr:hypothetical protein NDAI_0F02190 [Naumovozyma dairenensis CBS 421]CCD25537.1 hypothetical protein NDAI_0F02190 [Naumovozyma dairenensis CBS 421]
MRRRRSPSHSNHNFQISNLNNSSSTDSNTNQSSPQQLSDDLNSNEPNEPDDSRLYSYYQIQNNTHHDDTTKSIINKNIINNIHSNKINNDDKNNSKHRHRNEDTNNDNENDKLQQKLILAPKPIQNLKKRSTTAISNDHIISTPQGIPTSSSTSSSSSDSFSSYDNYYSSSSSSYNDMDLALSSASSFSTSLLLNSSHLSSSSPLLSNKRNPLVRLSTNKYNSNNHHSTSAPTAITTKNNISSISSSNKKQDKSIILKRYPHDPSSTESLNIDHVIEKLLKLGINNTTTTSTSKKKSSTISSSSSKKKIDYQNFPFHTWEIQLICNHAREIFMNQPTLLKLQAPIKIVGDIHGQFNDLLRILKLSGLPSQTNYLFLGDYVDRGKQSLETILLLLSFKIKYPNNFFMLRGNHESPNITKIYGFYDECKRRKNSKIWKSFMDTFNSLPLAAIINDKIFCVHGGISPDLFQLKQIESIQRPTDIPDKGLITDLLWSDPNPTINSWSKNDRGVSFTFSKKNVLEFIKNFNFDLIIRGHMVVEDGYEFFAKKKLVTIFSAPNYCGEFQNWGAVMSVTTGLMCSFELLKPQSYPPKTSSSSSRRRK